MFLQGATRKLAASMGGISESIGGSQQLGVLSESLASSSFLPDGSQQSLLLVVEVWAVQGVESARSWLLISWCQSSNE